MKASPVSPAAEAGTELHLFGNSAGEAGVEFGLKAFFIVKETPWAEHSDWYSAAGFRISVSAPPQIVVSLGSLPCRGCARKDAPKTVGPKPE